MNTNTQEEKIPTKKEMLEFYDEQIEVQSRRLELQKINTELAKQKAEELKAWAISAQFMSPANQEEDTDSESDEESPVPNKERKLARDTKQAA